MGLTVHRHEGVDAFAAAAFDFLGRREAEHNLLQLARGRRFCFLFTDLANPTSNAIYRAIGYEPVCDMDQYRFDRWRPVSVE